MKKIFYILLLLCVGLVGSCKTDDFSTTRKGNEIEFERSIYFLPSESSVEVSIAVLTPVSADVRVAFSVEGTAVENEDYTISAKEFVIRAGQTTGTITISPTGVEEQGKEIRLRLNPVSGYVLGNNKVTLIPVQPVELLYWSFARTSSLLVEELVVEITLTGEKTGENFKAGADIAIPFEILSSTTAIDGKHYIVKDDATQFVIPRNSRRATITLISQEKVAGVKPFIDFTLKPNDEKFRPGNFDTHRVTITGPIEFADLEGKWTYDSCPMEETPQWSYFEMAEMFYEDDPTLIPMGSTDDMIEFKTVGSSQMLVPNMVSSLKDFFRESVIRDPKPYTYENVGAFEPKFYTTQFTLSTVNYSFSPNDENIQSARILMRFRKDGNTMDMFLVDYAPTYFLTGMWEDFGEEFDEEVFTLHYIFKRVIEPEEEE